ncbi:hypothetical protein LCGC14_1482300, partial [marine sediment metagenome]
LQAMKDAGIKGICVGSWHGIDSNPYVKRVLNRARGIGLDTATYFVYNNRNGKETTERAFNACGPIEWDACLFHAPDVEIRGITEQILRDGLKATEDAGGWPIIYTGNWFWNWWRLDLGYDPDFTAWPSWIAVYNGRPDLAVTPAPGLGTMRIHQYAGSTQAFGTTVDFNVANKDWMDLARARFSKPAPVPEPTPEPSPIEEDIMGKIADSMHATGLEIERQMAEAKKLPTPIPGPAGVDGKDGRDGKDAVVVSSAQRTHTVVSGDTLGAIAGKYGTTWQLLYEANKAIVGPDPDLIQPGMVLVIP